MDTDTTQTRKHGNHKPHTHNHMEITWKSQTNPTHSDRQTDRQTDRLTHT